MNLIWKRDGTDWILLAGRRRMGRVVPDAKWPGMWRSTMSGGRFSDMANLTWAKNAVLVAAERELDYEARTANAPPEMPRKERRFRAHSLACAFARGGRYHPSGGCRMTPPTPRLRVGSILRRTEDDKRFVVRSIHKVATQPHTGFSQVVGIEPQPHPLQPNKAPRKRKNLAEIRQRLAEIRQRLKDRP
jgi:hypothetical protein